MSELEGFVPYKMTKRGRPRKRKTENKPEATPPRETLLRLSGALDVMATCKGVTITEEMAMMFGHMAKALRDALEEDENADHNQGA